MVPAALGRTFDVPRPRGDGTTESKPRNSKLKNLTKYDPQTEIRRVSPVLSKEESQDG